MADLADHIEKVKKYTSSPNEAAVAAIVNILALLFKVATAPSFPQAMRAR
jgi:hypothetical protein